MSVLILSVDITEVSDEINACSVVTSDVIGVKEPGSHVLQNETHNHPTEIRNHCGPLLYRWWSQFAPQSFSVYQAYAYSALVILQPDFGNRDGKLPQQVSFENSSSWLSSATGIRLGLGDDLCSWVLPPQLCSKRMELCAVVGAAPKGQCCPQTGSRWWIILLGGDWSWWCRCDRVS